MRLSVILSRIQTATIKVFSHWITVKTVTWVKDRTFKQRSKPWWQCRSDKKKQEWLAKAKNAGYETEQEMWHSLCKALPNRLIGKIWGVSGSCINHRAIKCGVPLKRGQKYRGPQTPVCPKCQTPLTPASDEKIIWLRQCGCSL